LPDPLSSPWWSPSLHGDRRPHLTERGRIRRSLRAWFEAEGFVEVEAGQLQVSPGNEAHLHAFSTEIVTPAGERSQLYLHTSPEFAAKKLLAAGERRIFEFARVFRNRERGPLHHPEFTMLEWYAVGEPYEAMMDDCIAIVRRAAQGRPLTWRDGSVDPEAPVELVRVAEAFTRYAGVDLFADDLAAEARRSGIRVADDDVWADVFSRIMVEKIEPRLGDGRLTILCEYPVAEAALARPCPHDPRVAERFELYACGVELANAFGELTDPIEQRRRFEAEMDEMSRVYGERYPVDEDLLSALVQMPPASGCALGFDRLVMLVTGARTIEQVLWTPVPETF